MSSMPWASCFLSAAMKYLLRSVTPRSAKCVSSPEVMSDSWWYKSISVLCIGVAVRRMTCFFLPADRSFIRLAWRFVDGLR